MRTLQILRLGLSAVIVAASLCAAAGVSGASGSGAGAAPSRYPPFGSAGAMHVTGLEANNYVALLDASRISSLPSTHQLQLSSPGLSDPYRSVPFWDRTPLFTPDTLPSTVEQALRDYGQVGILDRSTGAARKIGLENGRLVNGVFNDPAHVLQYFYGFDSNIHDLGRVHQRLPYPDRPQRVSTESLPHFNARPIIQPTQSSAMPQIVHGYSTGPKELWYKGQDGKVYLMSKDNRNLFKAATPQEAQSVNRALSSADRNNRVYGGGQLPSLLHGQPVPVDPSKAQQRAQKVPLEQYPRFNAQTATRQQLIDALQEKGKLRYYSPEGGAWKAKLKNGGAPAGTSAEVEIKPLTALEKAGEKLKGVHIPI